MTSPEDPIFDLHNFDSLISIFEPEDGAAHVMVNCSKKVFDKKLAEQYIYDEMFLNRKIKIKWEIYTAK